MNSDEEGLTWQIGVWNQISHLYGREVDTRFSSVVEAVINRASLEFGERVLDLGTGTGGYRLPMHSSRQLAWAASGQRSR
jgi:hypothetical protein